MLEGLDRNPVVQFLGIEYDGAGAYLKETLYFLYAVAIVQGISRSSKNWLHTIGLGWCRAFGDLSVCLPLVLGTMPGMAFKNFDWFFWTIVGAMIWCWASDKFIPRDISKHLEWAYKGAYSIIKANNAGIGYAMAESALPGSQIAPWIGAWLGVNGHRCVELGIAGLKPHSDEDDVLAVSAGIWMGLMTEHLGASRLFVRAFLVVFHFSCHWVNWNGYLSKVINTVQAGVTGGKSPRGRSRTPSRR